MAGTARHINPGRNRDLSRRCLIAPASLQPEATIRVAGSIARVSESASLIAEFDLPDAAATQALGATLAARLKVGDVVALQGDLGAGKTELARGLIRALFGADTDVPSPTFTLVQTYEADSVPLSLWHFDLYRLEDPEEVFELGIEDAFADAVSLIEWPERLGPYLPVRRLEIALSHDGNGRRASLSGGGDWPERLEGLTL